MMYVCLGYRMEALWHATANPIAPAIDDPSGVPPAAPVVTAFESRDS
jgi:hypothetical protein